MEQPQALSTIHLSILDPIRRLQQQGEEGVEDEDHQQQQQQQQHRLVIGNA
jgi:hypothetical protein